MQWWCSGYKNLPANAVNTGFIPGLGRSHKPQGNEACATTIKVQALEPVLFNKRSHHSEKQLESSPGSLQLEKACAQQ